MTLKPSLKARINSRGKARENSIVRIVKKNMNKIKRMLKFGGIIISV
jgi:hypothetical protein